RPCYEYHTVDLLTVQVVAIVAVLSVARKILKGRTDIHPASYQIPGGRRRSGSAETRDATSVSVGRDDWSTHNVNVSVPIRTESPGSRTVSPSTRTPCTNVPFLLSRSSTVTRVPLTMKRA